MLGTTLISRNHFRMSRVRKLGLNLVFKELEKYTTLKNRYFNFWCKTLTSIPYNCLAKSKLSNLENLSYRYSTAQDKVLKQENDVETKSYFQDMLHFRKMQAHRSVLVEVTEKDNIPFAIGYCEKYGSITNIYSFSRENKNYFLLLEFSNEIAPQKLLENSKRQCTDAFICPDSRIIRYEKTITSKLPEVYVNVNEENSSEISFKLGASITEVMHHIYATEKLTELDTRLRFFLCSLLKDSVSSDFPHCDMLPFGSSVNGVGRHGCDLDIIARLYPEQMKGDGKVFFANRPCVGNLKSFQKQVLQPLLSYFLLLPEIYVSQKILHARVPILKMKHTILNMDFDVSVNNMSALYMSDIIHFCGEIDPRVRPLIYVVKKWAKEANITMDVPGSQISNFGLTNLVLFFLQTRPQRILPPLTDAVTILNSGNGYEFPLRYLKSVEDWKKCASVNKDSLGVLLKEFFLFLSTYNFHQKIISLWGGEDRSREDNSTPIYIEYVLDESLNITRNVSKVEYDTLCEKAGRSAKCLEQNLNQKIGCMQDFSVVLDIPSISQIIRKSQANSYENRNQYKNKYAVP